MLKRRMSEKSEIIKSIQVVPVTRREVVGDLVFIDWATDHAVASSGAGDYTLLAFLTNQGIVGSGRLEAMKVLFQDKAAELRRADRSLQVGNNHYFDAPSCYNDNVLVIGL